MGLDVYFGPLTRYALGDWLTAVQQAAQAQGMEARVVRAEPDPEDAITDPVEVADAAREFQDAPAYKRAAANPTKYPTLLAGVEWWLPYETGPTVFEAPQLTGQPTRMGRVDQLLVELELLAANLGLNREVDLVQLRQAGPPELPSDVDNAGRFGLAVFIQLARAAQKAKQPLLLDY